MIQLIERHRDDLESLCRRYHVGTLEVFGSAAGQTLDSNAGDLDFLVTFHQTEEMTAADQYFGLL